MENTLQILKQYFGYDSFRDGQADIINSILSGRDCLAVMPTGAGKSICFQIPALMLDGITLVISPLISLMKDQVTALIQAGVKAAYINSSLTERQVYMALENAKKGMYKIIYVAPERLEAPNFLDFSTHCNISMVTVDEAHCISHWGQDFRPAYLKIASFLDSLPKRPVVSAFTATATAEVRIDIINHLKLSSPDISVTGFDRKNLKFSVDKPKNKFDALLRFLSENEDHSGIVYCSTRKTVEEVCDKLNDLDHKATRYHAGLSDSERHKNQDDFLYDRAQIMVATNAFGMGIDKSNVSFVVHYNMPKNIESYYQEAGRAGRDGEPAECLLLYSGQDVRINMFLIENSNDVEYTDPEMERIVKERDRQRLREMTFYCHTNGCLRAYILKYFGEITRNYCGNCSCCLSSFDTVDITIEAQKILSCIIRTGEFYGAKTIIDVLRGSNSEKIRRSGLDKLSVYNISILTENRLREIINHLVLEGFLSISDDKYSVLKRGERAAEILRNKIQLEMKLLKEKSTTSPTKPVRKAFSKELFDKLAALRSKIAAIQGVPAFVIFHDSTLSDMCIKMPSNESELMQVSGVGQTKLERYGEKFLEAIAEFKNKAPTAESAEPVAEASFSDVEISNDAVSVSIIADRINCILIRRGDKKLTGAKINKLLIEKGYLDIITDNYGNATKVPTDKGLEIGITSEKRIIRDKPCKISMFNEKAQRFVLNIVKAQFL